MRRAFVRATMDLVCDLNDLTGLLTARVFNTGYEYVLIGACAMTLGCKIRSHVRTMLTQLNASPNTEMPPEADEQIEAALIGPAEKIYKSGEPFDFYAEGLIESAGMAEREIEERSKASNSSFVMMNVPVGGIFRNPVRKTKRKVEDPAAVAKGAFGDDRCAGCGVAGSPAAPLLMCGRCKRTKYCDKVCRLSTGNSTRREFAVRRRLGRLRVLVRPMLWETLKWTFECSPGPDYCVSYSGVTRRRDAAT